MKLYHYFCLINIGFLTYNVLNRNKSLFSHYCYFLIFITLLQLGVPDRRSPADSSQQVGSPGLPGGEHDRHRPDVCVDSLQGGRGPCEQLITVTNRGVGSGAIGAAVTALIFRLVALLELHFYMIFFL